MPLYNFYVEPGVYIKTIREISGTPLPSNLRLPVIIGEGAETVPVADLGMVRASSNTVDNYSKQENVTARFLDSVGNFTTPNAVSKKFKVKNIPIVTGEGSGKITRDPGHVVVTINGQPAGVTRVEGDTGIVHLSQLTVPGDVVKASYYYDIRDTLVTDEDLSFQVDGTKTVFKVLNARIVDGTNGGVTATSVSSIKVKVDGAVAVPSSLNAVDGTFTLATAPPVGSILLVTYYSNNYENTSDPFPETSISAITRVGNNPGRLDYVNGVDYVLDGDTIMWGNASKTSYLLATPGAGNEVFDDTQITTTLIDNKAFIYEMSGTANGTNKVFRGLGEIVDGSGRGKVTDDVSKVTVYVGTSVQNAVLSGPVVVDALSGRTGDVTLHVAPSAGNKVYATFNYNLLSDSEFNLVVTASGIAGVGEYTITSPDTGSLAVVSEGSHTVADAAAFAAAGGILFPGGSSSSDLQTIPGVSVTETVTLTFTSATDFTVTSTNALGSSGSGSINQTYIDQKTGLRFTILDPNTVSDVDPDTEIGGYYDYAAGDTLVFVVTVGDPFVADDSNVVLQIPGLRLVVSDTENVPVDDSAVIKTYNKSGKEPSVGSLYFVSYEFNKTDYSVFLASNEREITILSGPINLENRLSLAARICLRNGALRVGLKQVKRAADSALASSQAYIEAIIEQETKLRNGVNQDVLVPLTGDPDVWGLVKAHVEKMSSQFYDRQRRVAILGFNLGTEPEDAIPIIKSLDSERVWVVYPDGVIISYVDELGRSIEAAVDGSFLAAGIAGFISNPAVDAAEPLIGKNLVDFQRLIRNLDPFTTKDIITAGTIFLRDTGTSLRIVDAYTTRYGELLFEEPNVTLIDDEIANDCKTALERYIGRKSLASLEPAIARTINQIMTGKVTKQIISDFKDIIVQLDPDDPRVGRVSVAYRPIFALKWIEMTLFVRSNF